jgi:hypothetical protein
MIYRDKHFATAELKSQTIEDTLFVDCNFAGANFDTSKVDKTILDTVGVAKSGQAPK